MRAYHYIATSAGMAVGSFFLVYATIPALFVDDGATMLAVMMAATVSTSLSMLVLGKYFANRKLATFIALVLEALGIALLGVPWVSQVLIGVGFGLHVVTGTAWVKESAPSDLVSKAIGLYGFGVSLGSALGAPVGLVLQKFFDLKGFSAVVTCIVIISAMPLIRVPAKTRRHLPMTGAIDVVTAAMETVGARRTGMIIGLGGHFVAVSMYAIVLSTVHSMPAAVLAAFIVQLAMGIGRLSGGRLNAKIIIPVSVLLLIFGAAGYLLLGTAVAGGVSGPLAGVLNNAAVWAMGTGLILCGAAVGLASGWVQSALLTSMMKQARTTRENNLVSIGWNVFYDGGLGFGAVLAGLTAIG